MLLLKATERNWGLIGPGDWEKRTWKIHMDGTYQLKTTYLPVDPDDHETPEVTEEGALYEEQLEALKEHAGEYWNDDTADACDGSAWEFKLYDENGTVIRHRDLGYIYGIEPYESIASLLLSEKPGE